MSLFILVGTCMGGFKKHADSTQCIYNNDKTQTYTMIVLLYIEYNILKRRYLAGGQV